MNTQGVALEARAGRSLMSGLHGAWSLGGLAGSAIGVLAAHADVDARIHLGAMALLLLAVTLLAGRRLPARAAERATRRPLAWPTRPVLVIGLVGFGAVFAEGASADWCAVYLRDVVGAGAATAAAAYTGFAAAMAPRGWPATAWSRALRPGRDRPGGRRRWRRSARCWSSSRERRCSAIPGFALIGLGIATVVPLAFAAGGPRRAARGPGHRRGGDRRLRRGPRRARDRSARSRPPPRCRRRSRSSRRLCVGFGLGAGALRPAAHGR